MSPVFRPRKKFRTLEISFKKDSVKVTNGRITKIVKNSRTVAVKSADGTEKIFE